MAGELNNTELRTLGTIPYERLRPEEQRWIALGTPSQLDVILASAEDQNPPNLSLIAAISAVCIRAAHYQGPEEGAGDAIDFAGLSVEASSFLAMSEDL